MNGTPLTPQERRGVERAAPRGVLTTGRFWSGRSARRRRRNCGRSLTASKLGSAPSAGFRLQRELVSGVCEPLKSIEALNQSGVDYVVVGGWGTLPSWLSL